MSEASNDTHTHREREREREGGREGGRITLTSENLCRSCPGCFFAKSRMTSGVLNASLMAAWIAFEEEKRRERGRENLLVYMKRVQTSVCVTMFSIHENRETR